MNQISWPPHSSRLHQVPPEYPSPSKPQHLPFKPNQQTQIKTTLKKFQKTEGETNLSCYNNKKGHKEGDVLFIEHLDDGNNVNGVDGAGPGVCKDCDENMLFHIERPRIQRELPPPSFSHKN